MFNFSLNGTQTLKKLHLIKIEKYLNKKKEMNPIRKILDHWSKREWLLSCHFLDNEHEF